MKEILIIGDSCIDIHVYGECNRLCPDAPVPVFLPKKEKHTEGMAGNVYNNIRILGGSAELITNNRQVTKKRFVDDKTNQMIIRVDDGESNLERIEDVREIDLNKYDCVIISDYNKGFLLEEDIQYICNNHDLVFIDTKKIIGEFCVNAKYIKINEIEYKLSKKNIEKLNINDNLIVTLGSKGARHKGKLYPVEKVDIKDQTGAGDTFISSLVIKYLETGDIEKSIKYANKASSWVVTQRGVTVIDKNKI